MPISQDPQKRANQLANLSPEAGKLGGRPKGSRSWSTLVQDLLNDEELFATLVQNMERKPAWLIPTGTRSLMQAVTVAQAIKAMGGSHFSAEWLRKTGFGDKIDITSNGETIKAEPIIVSNIKARGGYVQEGEIVAEVEEPELFTPEENIDDPTARS